MNGYEAALRVLVQVEPLLPLLLIVAVPTLIALPVLLLASRGLWVDRRAFHWLGLFLGLKGWDCVRLSGAWVKLLLLLAYLAAFQKLSAAHYLLFLIAGLAYCLSPRDLARIPGRVLWLLLELVALVSCNLLCGYIREVNGAALIVAAYALMAAFTALFGAYLFLTELNDISAGRHTKLEYEWQENPEN